MSIGSALKNVLLKGLLRSSAKFQRIFPRPKPDGLWVPWIASSSCECVAFELQYCDEF